ncbi:hypothetical protein ACS0TY_029282 [Phlomoides rotata]
MEASATGPLSLPNPPPPQPNLEKIKHKLLKFGVEPTPRILHNLRKKELQKSNRRISKQNAKLLPPLSDAQKQAILEESHFQTIKSEFKKFSKSVGNGGNGKLVGVPWERLERLQLRELASETMEYDGEKLNSHHLRELSDIIESERDKFSWLLDNDIEVEEGWFEDEGRRWAPKKRSEIEATKLLIDRLSATELSVKDWKFTRMMRYSGLQFTEVQMLKLVEGLGYKGQWRHALSVVEWVYSSKEQRHCKNRFVYTKLLSVLGRRSRSREALQIFNLMRGDAHIYPDMAAYHSLAVTLGQAGFLKELLNVIELMKEKPKKIRNMRRKNWNPELQPDIVVFNAVLNACVQTCQWKGVSWVFQQLRKNSLRPNGASYGLAMEVMLKSGKYDVVHELFQKMKRSGEAVKALTYKVLVRAYWEEGKVNDAVQAVRDMERRGVIGVTSVYYELARCLCFYGRWQDAILEIEKLKALRRTRPLAVTYTGMIISSMDGGHFHNCVNIFEHSKTLTAPDIGLINAMLKVYGRNDMFLKSKELFEDILRNDLGSEIREHGHNHGPRADAFTFSCMLEASARAQQWEYFEYVYKEMALSGHQVDQRKHSALLVEASRAGKWHLLEHAFDSILEAGEVPPLSFFTEMVCEATIQHDHERVVSMVNAMAHAPFQVSLQEWINYFERNRDGTNWASLKELEKKLVSHDLVKEATALNFSRALQIICGSCEDENPEAHFGNSCNSNIDGNLNIKDKDSDEESGLLDNSDVDSGKTHSAGFAEHFDCNLESKSSRVCSDVKFERMEDEERECEDDEEFNFELIIPNNDDDWPHGSDAPSAHQILETWRRNK